MTRYLRSLCCSVFLSTGVMVLAETDTAAQRAAELESLRAQIQDVEASIQQAGSRSEELLQELQEFESAAARVAGTIAELQGRIAEKKDALARLEAEQNTQEAALSNEQKLLAQQIRVAYKTGRNDYIKLLLNQEDPALVGRVLAYHKYLNRARTQRITTVTAALEQIIATQQSIASEAQQLTQLQASEETRLDEYSAYRRARGKTLQQLEEYTRDQNRQLEMLQRDEAELALLIAKLQEQESIVERYENLPPFASLKGTLNWPLDGRFAHRFGQQKKGGRLRWQGVIIQAQNGADIHAVSTGKVIFAEWFRNMGLLLILDHGDGYMSLYGHNQALIKKSGDWVKTGEVIARAGDTGGQQEAALYFEIRKNGTPENPQLWCRK